MEDKDDIIAGDIGASGKYDLDLIDNKLKLSISYDGPGVDGGAFVIVDPADLLDKLADAIPGEIDDAVINALKGAFLS